MQSSIISLVFSYHATIHSCCKYAQFATVSLYDVDNHETQKGKEVPGGEAVVVLVAGNDVKYEDRTGCFM